MAIDPWPTGTAASAYFAYVQTLKDLEGLWAQDEVAFTAAECRSMSAELRRRATELQAQARDWEQRALDTDQLENSTR